MSLEKLGIVGRQGCNDRRKKKYYQETRGESSRWNCSELKFNKGKTVVAILNILVHNDWTITEPHISMFHDRLEILSHEGLSIVKYGSLQSRTFIFYM